MDEAAANGEPEAASGGGQWRDKDPPPSFDGEVEGFKSYLRDLRIWRHETDAPSRKHGAKMLRGLTGPAKDVCEEIEIDQLLSEQGADLIIAKLKEYFQPHLETSMPKAFEKAVYGEPRKAKEGFSEFILRQDAAFRGLAEEGVKLSDQVKGYVMFRQGNLSQAQEDQVTTWTKGAFERGEVIRAFRKLDKVQREKSGRHYATYEMEEEVTPEDEEDDSEEFVYLGDGDLQQVYEENEIQEALATYQQVRKAIKEQKTARGYFPHKPTQASASASGSFKGGKGKFTGSIRFGGKGGGTKVHVDLLKLRTKCARCGQIGHWARECVNEPDSRGKRSAGAESTAVKSGFFEVNESEGTHFQVTLGQCLRESSQSITPSAATPKACEVGIVDTAAQGGLVGKERLRELEKALGTQGLRIKWMDKKAQARGIGGEASVCGVAELPIGVAGVNGVIEVTVVEDKVPLLLSIKFLKEVAAVVDLVNQNLELRRFGKSCDLINMDTGHVGVNILHFAPGGWQCPDTVPGRHKDFRFWSTAVFSSAACMSHAESSLKSGSTSRHAAFVQDDEDAERRSCTISAKAGRPCKEVGARHSKLACHHGKDGRSHGLCQSPGKAQRMARRWIHAWLTVFIASSTGIPALGTFLPTRMSVQGELHEGRAICRADSQSAP